MKTKTTLRLERTYKAPLEEVRTYLTEPALLARWFAPGDMQAEVRADARVGGHYEISMQGNGPDGKPATHTCAGVYEVLEPTRVVATFNWKEQPLPQETRLIFELEPVDGGTRLVLIHEGLPGDEAVAMHRQGWEGCLAKLEEAVPSGS